MRAFYVCLLRAIPSNLQHRRASKVNVSSHTKGRAVATVLLTVCAMAPVIATPIDTGMNIPQPTVRYVPAQLTGRAPRIIAANPRQTFDRLGPQATERAVRSSLKVALVPDPLAMGALIFCAFALRWMKAQKGQRTAAANSVTATTPVLPRTA